jgi:cysteine desulfuration protein SufE
MTIKEIQDEIIDELKWFEGDDEEKLKYVIDLGKTVPSIDEKFITDEHKIKGCQSDLWFKAELKESNIIFTATAAAIIPRGIVSILIRTYSNQTPKDILENDIFNFLREAGLENFFSMTRSNGLEALAKKIKYYALGFSIKK